MFLRILCTVLTGLSCFAPIIKAIGSHEDLGIDKAVRLFIVFISLSWRALVITALWTL